MMKRSFGFTLGEILIALGVIGIVAALVIPQLISGHKASVARAQFDTAYEIISKSIVDMETDNVSVSAVSYPTNTFYAKYKNYHKFTVDCGRLSDSSNTSVCPKRGTNSSYKKLVGNNMMSIGDIDDGAFVLNNGMLIAMDNCVGCNHGADHNIWILVDINGYGKNPNRLGYDLFIFQLTNNGELLPLGALGTDKKFSEIAAGNNTTPAKSPSRYCCNANINPGCSAATENGYTCAYFALTDQDYFKKLYNGH